MITLKKSFENKIFFTDISALHVVPEKLAGHVQMKPPPAGISVHVPLFKHG